MAGVTGPKGYLEEIDWMQWTHAIEVNLYGPVLMCRALLPHFKANRHGKIINLSGGGATAPMPRMSAPPAIAAPSTPGSRFTAFSAFLSCSAAFAA